MVLKYGILLSIVCFALGSGIFFLSQSGDSTSSSSLRKTLVQINGNVLEVEIARTSEERSQGLSGRKESGREQGMLFVFEEPGIYGFWMKDMSFPIDIIWIDSDKRIIGIKESIVPETFPQTFLPTDAIQYALEVPAGWVKTHKVFLGDEVVFQGVF